jgi:UDP-glucuronate 4-epimerase
LKILVTGAAGFIGMHVALAALKRGDTVVGLDNLNAYYDADLKRARLRRLQTHARFRFEQIDIADRAALDGSFAHGGFDRVVHLAAQAGVRHSLSHPHAYGQSNLVGFLNLLESCRQQRIAHLVYASSSSVYGGNRKMPFAEDDPVDHPVSLYAATKKANELMAHSYSHLYGLPTSGLRFFTVYGPWGRPDMAYYQFAHAICSGESIKVFNHGDMRRDFTYIDDVVDAVLPVLDAPPESETPYRILNVGSHAPVALLDFIAVIENALGRKATLELLPMQPGDVPATYADVSRLQALTGALHSPTPLEVGVRRFVRWYRDFHHVAVPHPTHAHSTPRLTSGITA